MLRDTQTLGGSPEHDGTPRNLLSRTLLFVFFPSLTFDGRVSNPSVLPHSLLLGIFYPFTTYENCILYIRVCICYPNVYGKRSARLRRPRRTTAARSVSPFYSNPLNVVVCCAIPQRTGAISPAKVSRTRRPKRICRSSTRPRSGTTRRRWEIWRRTAWSTKYVQTVLYVFIRPVVVLVRLGFGLKPFWETDESPKRY